MTQPTIIALTSVRGRSGKDTLIEELQKVGHKVHRVAFGDVLKEQCARDLMHNCFTYEDLIEWFHSDAKDHDMPGLAIRELAESPYAKWLCSQGLNNEADRSPRWHLQQYGTNYRRVHLNDPDVWLNAGIAKIAECPEDHIVVVTDLRQQNEYCRLVELTEGKFYPVRIQRMWFKAGVDDADYHVTDVDLIGFFMRAVVLNQWGKPEDMVDQLKRQGVPV